MKGQVHHGNVVLQEEVLFLNISGLIQPSERTQTHLTCSFQEIDLALRHVDTSQHARHESVHEPNSKPVKSTRREQVSYS